MMKSKSYKKADQLCSAYNTTLRVKSLPIDRWKLEWNFTLQSDILDVVVIIVNSLIQRVRWENLAKILTLHVWELEKMDPEGSLHEKYLLENMYYMYVPY